MTPRRPDGHQSPPSSHPPLRTRLVILLRTAHGWIGLWGATLGLLFGISGIWLNHRAVLPLQPAIARDNFELALPDPAPADAVSMGHWLRASLQLPRAPATIRVEPSRPAAWVEAVARAAPAASPPNERDRTRGGDAQRTREREPGASFAPAASAPASAAAASASAPVAAASAVAAPMLVQPEHWTFNFPGPQAGVQAEYWVGNRSISVRRSESGVIGMLMNLHKGVGMPVPWILLVDTLAGSLILLSLSGLTLWMLTHRRRVVGLAIFGTALAITAGLAIARL